MLPRFRFRLASLFSAVALVALGLAALQRWVYVPMRTGVIYTAIASQRDWNQFTASQPSQQEGDFKMYKFGEIAPESLFKLFSPMPQLWGQIDVRRYRRGDIQMPRRSRPGHSPLGGWEEWKPSSDEWETDQLGFCGVFQESAIPPKRYVIDCKVALTIGIRSNQSTRPPALVSQLRYLGPARGLMVFSRPIDDELVQLLILDMR